MKAFGSLSLSALLLLIAGYAVTQTKPQKPNNPKPKVGLELYSVREDCAKDLPGVLKAVAKMGYQGVEFAGYHGRTAEELRKLLDENGLKCCGTHIALDALLGENLEKTIAFNKTLGNKYLIVAYLPENRLNTKEKCIATAKIFNEVARKLEPHGMMTGYHCHDGDFKPMASGEIPWDMLFDNLDKKVVMQFDIGNAMSAGVQAAPYLEKYPGRALTVHIKDHSKTNNKALLGEGDVNWKEVIPLLRGKAGTEWFIIEQESYAFPPLECVEKCLRNFEKMVK
jgi:sugar phosphate isomerase/epimerase